MLDGDIIGNSVYNKRLSQKNNVAISGEIIHNVRRYRQKFYASAFFASK
jgi:hypothetical protein